MKSQNDENDENEEEQAKIIVKQFMDNAKRPNLTEDEQAKLLALTLSNVDHLLRSAVQIINQAHGKIEDIISQKIYRDCKDNSININTHYDMLDTFNNLLSNASSLRLQVSMPLRKFLKITEEKRVEDLKNPPIPDTKEEVESEESDAEECLMNAFNESEIIMGTSKEHFEGIVDEEENKKSEAEHFESSKEEVEFFFNPNFSEETGKEEEGEEGSDSKGPEGEEAEED